MLLHLSFFIVKPTPQTTLRETQSEITNNRSALISFVLFISLPEERPQQGNASAEHICFTAETRSVSLLNHCGSALFEHFFTFKLLQRETTQAFLLESVEPSRKLIRFRTNSCRNTWDSSPDTLFILTVCFNQAQYDQLKLHVNLSFCPSFCFLMCRII